MNEVVVIAPGSPYKGLAAFDDSPADALFFFGREREAEVIAANVMASRFTVLYGPLGVGKSSVLRAGVVRRLRSRAPDALVVVHDSWAGDAVGDLVRAVASTLRVDAPPPDVPLADALAQLVGRSGGELLLILDQFEEVFVYPGAGAVAASLAEVVMRADVRVDVLLALREDALAELDVFTGRIPDVFGNHLPLDRLDRAAARVAITGPVARFNELTDGPPVEIEHELVEAVLEQVEVGRVAAGGRDGQARAGGDGSIEAPYLQLVMERLWRAEQGRGSTVLRRATLDELGGAQAIVRAHLGAAVGALSPAERDVAARVFNHLVTPSGTKIAHGAGDLAQYAAVDEAELLPVLESLGRDRIVRPVDGRFEIFHDVLADAVSAWRTRHEAERALQLQRAEAERRHRRLLLLLASTVTALAVVAVIAIYALTQRSEAREQAGRARAEATTARANALATQASLLVPITAVAADPQLGLLLAAEAARLSPGGRTADLLRRALLVSHLRAVLPERGVDERILQPGRHSYRRGRQARHRERLHRRCAPKAADASPRPRGAHGGVRPRRAAPAHDGAGRAGADLGRAAGRAVACAGALADRGVVQRRRTARHDRGCGRARIWNAADGSKVAVLRQPDAVRHASFAPRGARVVTVGTGSVARIFDARSGARVAAVDQGGRSRAPH
jgi:hypothetical protein